jgi:putative membrane protein
MSLAATRTRMAADRTMMAWIRTALSLFSFGFTIYKVLQAFEEAGRVLPGANINTPRVVGLFLTGTGTLAILMGTTQYVMCLQELAARGRFPLARPPLLMALFMSVGGVALFVGIIARIF